MLLVPTAPVPSQNFTVNLDGQAVAINVYQLGEGDAAALYMDLQSNGSPIFTTRVCRGYGGQPGTTAPFMCIGRQYLGFLGDFVWIDTQASSLEPAEDPVFSGLGARWQLLYLTEADLEAGGLVVS